MNSPEQLHGAESNVEIQGAAGERSEQLRNLEAAGEQSPENQTERVDSARQETKEVFAKEAGKERKGAEPSGSAGAVRRVTKLEKKASYKKTMTIIRSDMNAPSRAFSKVIHAPFVEKSSEVLGSSLARPNAVLAGSFTALVLVMGIYVVARTFGYRLSGFETIGAFVLGWAVGIIFDYVKVMTTGKA
ncbi:hypothetical protein H7Y40_02315 [Pedobacter sp.]|nr:hypothetical protein [Candidatus Saccharibacteria bacterium]